MAQPTKSVVVVSPWFDCSPEETEEKVNEGVQAVEGAEIVFDPQATRNAYGDYRFLVRLQNGTDEELEKLNLHSHVSWRVWEGTVGSGDLNE